MSDSTLGKKEAKKAYDAARYLENRESRRAHNKEYYKNPENVAKRKAYLAARYPEKRESLLAYAKEYRGKYSEELSYIYLRKYGITSDEYNELFESQQGRCAICGGHQTEFKKRLHVDHDHDTGQVRGLLCGTCNTGLGMFRDNIDLLDKAIKYLGRSDQQQSESWVLTEYGELA